ncbi:MAG: ATP-binding protein [Verrucomicrobiota bacterium]
MIPRQPGPEFQHLLKEYPIVTVLGPRQSGKTTLVRESLPDYAYVSLEDPDTRELALADPRQFLRNFPGQAIFDEIQRAPELLNYLQTLVDSSKQKGQFVLTGSHQLELRQGITQTLAGRTAILTLYPLSYAELQDHGLPFDTFEDLAFHGTLPRVHADQIRPTPAYRDYYRTYVERDVRQLINLKDSALFEKFLKLLAGRVGQIADYSSLANDVGVSQKTIRSWLSILEASFITFRLTPYYENFGKRVIKSPKIYFIEPGLLIYLLGITKPDQISRDPLVGNIFENLIVTEALKTRANQGADPDLHFFRDSNGNEIDLLTGPPKNLTAIEIKSAATYNPAFLKGFRSFEKNNAPLKNKHLVYNGDTLHLPENTQGWNFKDTANLFSYE